jgi:hypothetical protein
MSTVEITLMIPSPSRYPGPTQCTLLKRNFFDILLDQPIINIAACYVAAFEPTDTGTPARSALNKFRPNSRRRERFQFGALLIRQRHFSTFSPLMPPAEPNAPGAGSGACAI